MSEEIIPFVSHAVCIHIFLVEVSWKMVVPLKNAQKINKSWQNVTIPSILTFWNVTLSKTKPRFFFPGILTSIFPKISQRLNVQIPDKFHDSKKFHVCLSRLLTFFVFVGNGPKFQALLTTGHYHYFDVLISQISHMATWTGHQFWHRRIFELELNMVSSPAHPLTPPPPPPTDLLCAIPPVFVRVWPSGTQ